MFLARREALAAALATSAALATAQAATPKSGGTATVRRMLLSRSRLATAALIASAAVALGAAGASALTQRTATPKKITAAGAGAVKIGASYQQLRAANLVGQIGPGCELAGPSTRSARLRSPLKGAVDLSQTSPRKVVNIAVSGGATARGVGIGASAARIRQAYPKAVVDRSTESVFRITLYKVPFSAGGRLQFAVDTKTKKVTTIGIPVIAFCE